MRVYVESVLDCSPDRAWSEVRTSRLLLEVIRPLLRFVPPQGASFPFEWEQSTTVRGRSYVLGLIPLGLHTIQYERVDADRREIQTREANRLVRRWDHLISIREISGERTLYSDEIDIAAGPMTWLMWLFAQCFYRHRQCRWKRVARRLSAV